MISIYPPSEIKLTSRVSYKIEFCRPNPPPPKLMTSDIFPGMLAIMQFMRVKYTERIFSLSQDITVGI